MTLLRPGDIVALALAALAAGSAYGVFWSDRSPGQVVVITVGDAVLAERSLSEPEAIAVDGLIGTSRIQIEEGRVRFIDSPCNARYCVHTGWLSNSGQVAACLPNGVVVTVEGGERVYDAITL